MDDDHLPLEPLLMRRAELSTIGESPYSSRPTSPNCENIINECSTIRTFVRTFIQSIRLPIIFVIIWIIAAALISAIEYGTPIRRESRIAANRRLEFLQRFGRFQHELPVDSDEWALATGDLIDWYRSQLIDESAPIWTGDWSTALVYGALMSSTIGKVPGMPALRLNTIHGRLLLIVWSPLAIGLHYYCLWHLSSMIARLSTNWQLTLLIAALCIVIGFVVFECLLVNSRSSSILIVCSVLFTIGTTSSVGRHHSPLSYLVFHTIVWTLMFYLYRCYLQWKLDHLYGHIIGTVSRDSLDQIYSQSSSSSKSTHLLIQIYASRSLITRLKSMLVTDWDRQSIDRIISMTRRQSIATNTCNLHNYI